MDLAAEREQLKRIRAATKRGGNGARREPAVVPRTIAEAAELLGVAPDASRTTVQRHWRDQVAKCHPDLVDGLHPALRARAQDLAVALNAARDLLIGAGVPTRRRRA
jgi:DnaJ-domain-containing protein 1